MSVDVWDADGSGISVPNVERCSIQRLRGREVILMSKDVSPELRSAVDALIDGMAFVENRTVREIMLRNFIKKFGEVPEEYRDAVYAVLEM